MNPSREKALEILKTHVKNEKMIVHSLCSEAVMKAIAKKLGQDEEKWGLAGLLHDVDVEVTNANPLTHGQVAINILRAENLDDEIISVIAMHNECSAPAKRSTVFEHALAAGETITGLIFATALVYPDKQIASVKVKSVSKRMKEKAFAATVKRENILECELIGIPLDEFIQISLTAMTDIKNEIGL